MKNKKNLSFIALLIILIGIVFFATHEKEVKISKVNEPSENISQNLSPISGIACSDYKRRPFAVMLAEDEVARPLSGLTAADLIIEMPVMATGMNRMMAIYVCGNPQEIGSIRSARHDFIPLAMGFDAILAHWGGSHFALDKLNTGMMDNIDALKYETTAFWRKTNLNPPHNGFTNIEKLTSKAKQLNYRLENTFPGYLHQEATTSSSKTAAKLTIGYPGIYGVWWRYDPATNSYLRWRNQKPERDFNNSQQVEAKNIVVMRASSHYLEDQYNDVDIEGEGNATFYFNGQVIQGKWEKEGHYEATKLSFYNDLGEEIRFVPGQIWIEIIEPDKEVSYTKISN
jgi:hypothetical protein